MNNCTQPYSDDYMIWDENTKHYVLTEKALIEKVGLNLRARMGERSLITPEVAIQSFNTTVSDMIYQFIYERNIDFLSNIILSLRTLRHEKVSTSSSSDAGLFFSINPAQNARNPSTRSDE